jgi:hypothetical protein
MIIVKNTRTCGWEAAIRGMRNPMNSWAKSDSCNGPLGYVVGENDLNLMKRLAKAGTDHRKFMRMITVYADITAPLYFWKEFDTYKVGTVANSCSTMHKIHAKEFTEDDFSCEHLTGAMHKNFQSTIRCLNQCRELYLGTKNKVYWWQMIQGLPASYNQKRTVMLNYEVLANIYRSRKNHKLDEWHDFCDWVESLPYSELIIGESNCDD